jgi:hypothetical protein
MRKYCVYLLTALLCLGLTRLTYAANWTTRGSDPNRVVDRDI